MFHLSSVNQDIKGGGLPPSGFIISWRVFPKRLQLLLAARSPTPPHLRIANISGFSLSLSLPSSTLSTHPCKLIVSLDGRSILPYLMKVTESQRVGETSYIAIQMRANTLRQHFWEKSRLYSRERERHLLTVRSGNSYYCWWSLATYTTMYQWEWTTIAFYLIESATNDKSVLFIVNYFIFYIKILQPILYVYNWL